MTDPIEYRNDLGQVSWQPRLESGERLIYVRTWGDEAGKVWATPSVNTPTEPVLYRLRKRAERIAERERQFRARENYREWRGVNHD